MALATVVPALSWLNHIGLLLAIYYALLFIRNIYFHPLSKVPGPRAWSGSKLPFVHALLRGTAVQDVQQLHRKYGPIVRIGPNHVTFAAAEAWPDIQQNRPNHETFLKDPAWWKRQPGHPESLTSAIDPGLHSQMRKALAPAFTARALRSQEPFLHRHSDRLVERLGDQLSEHNRKNGATQLLGIDIGPWLQFTTFDIYGDLAFGMSFGCLENSEYHPWIALVFDSVKVASFVAAARLYPWLEYVLLKCLPPSFKKVHQDHYQVVVEKVQRRLNLEVQRPDFVGQMIGASGLLPSLINGDTDHKGLTLDEISATFMILATAGSETTASVLTGTLNYLTQNPDKLAILIREIRTSFSSYEKITVEGVQNLPYLNAVLREGMRLCPPIPFVMPRCVPEGGNTVCGIWLPENTSVSIQAYSINRREDYFYMPDAFLPERWLPEARNFESPFREDRVHSLQPFNMGPRACLGQNLAWAEMRLIAAKVLWKFDFEAIPGSVVRWEDLKTFLLVEKRPIVVGIKGRIVQD
ncbi:cytochrome P450 [Xylaria flabelliformis]|nr:cytochrome P450 [Xylaria flabelliformis]